MTKQTTPNSVLHTLHLLGENTPVDLIVSTYCGSRELEVTPDETEHVQAALLLHVEQGCAEFSGSCDRFSPVGEIEVRRRHHLKLAMSPEEAFQRFMDTGSVQPHEGDPRKAYLTYANNYEQPDPVLPKRTPRPSSRPSDPSGPEKINKATSSLYVKLDDMDVDIAFGSAAHMVYLKPGMNREEIRALRCHALFGKPMAPPKMINKALEGWIRKGLIYKKGTQGPKVTYYPIGELGGRRGGSLVSLLKDNGYKIPRTRPVKG